jgi:hypothetical protein
VGRQPTADLDPMAVAERPLVRCHLELDGPAAIFDDERASSAWSGTDAIR